MEKRIGVQFFSSYDSHRLVCGRVSERGRGGEGSGLGGRLKSCSIATFPLSTTRWAVVCNLFNKDRDLLVVMYLQWLARSVWRGFQYSVWHVSLAPRANLQKCASWHTLPTILIWIWRNPASQTIHTYIYRYFCFTFTIIHRFYQFILWVMATYLSFEGTFFPGIELQSIIPIRCTLWVIVFLYRTSSFRTSEPRKRLQGTEMKRKQTLY